MFLFRLGRCTATSRKNDPRMSLSRPSHISGCPSSPLFSLFIRECHGEWFAQDWLHRHSVCEPFLWGPWPWRKGPQPGLIRRKTTTMRRTNRLQIRPIRALSGRFLQALIVEWLFPMHLGKHRPVCNERRCFNGRCQIAPCTAWRMTLRRNIALHRRAPPSIEPSVVPRPKPH